MTRFLKFIIALILTMGTLSLSAQCTGCSITVTDNAVSAYSVTNGNTLCISSGFTYTGTVYLQGGNICNNGSLMDIRLNSGVLNNNCNGVTFVSDAAGVLNLQDNIVINNYSGSYMQFGNNLEINSSSISRSITLNIHEGSSINVSNNFILNSGVLILNAGLAVTTVSDISSVCSMNVNGSSTLSSNFNVNLLEKGILNITGNLRVMDVGIKNITNHGLIHINGDFFVSGNGVTGSSISIDNYSEFEVNTMSLTIINASVNLHNFSEFKAEVNISSDLTIDQHSINIQNDALMYIGNSTSLSNGTITNNYHLSSGTFNNSTGLFTNNGLAEIIAGDFTNSNPSGILINNSRLITDVGGISNYGLINLGKNSLIRCIGFDNASSSSTVVGPSDILDEYSSIDSTKYAKIYIGNVSRNAGLIDGNVIVFDLTPDGSYPYFIDDATEGSFGDGYMHGHSCSNYAQVGFLEVLSSLEVPRTSFCSGEDVLIHYTPNLPVVGSLSWTFYGGYISTTTYTNNSFLIHGITSSGCVQVSGNYYNRESICSFNFNLCLTVVGGSIIATSPVYFGVGNTVTLNSTVAIGTSPCQFTWTPNVFFQSPGGNLVEDPIISPGISLTYTVAMRDLFGCTSTTTVMVIGEPFAVPDKELNGEYYVLFDDKLFFKYEGQYDFSTLRYNVYDATYSTVANSSGSASNLVNISTLKPGDNRYTLNAGSLASGSYILELLNEKKEKLYLRFIK